MTKLMSDPAPHAAQKSRPKSKAGQVVCGAEFVINCTIIESDDQNRWAWCRTWAREIFTAASAATIGAITFAWISQSQLPDASPPPAMHHLSVPACAEQRRIEEMKTRHPAFESQRLKIHELLEQMDEAYTRHDFECLFHLANRVATQGIIARALAGQDRNVVAPRRPA